MAVRVNLLNTNVDAAGWLFDWWTPPTMVPMHFLDGEELPKICSKCVHRAKPELHIFMLHQDTSYSKPNVDAAGRQFEWWTLPSILPINFLGEEELTKSVSSVFVVHSLSYTFLLLQYTSAMAVIVHLLNINGDAAGRLFKKWTPPSMIPMNFQDGKELTKICIHHIQPELHTFLLLQYTSAMAAIVNLFNINGDAAGRMFERWTLPSIVPMHFLDGEEVSKICSKCVCCIHLLLLQYTSAMAAIGNQLNIRCWLGAWTMKASKHWTTALLGWWGAAKKCVRRIQPELHTFLLLQYTSAKAAIVNLLNVNGDAACQLFKRWTPSSMVPRNFLD